ncbi:DUF788-domain-containing protein [Epithele typhae]|uniref:DUF788-domain-containing protein n=1 Tax=Epithele typhae TaxID=378194 RepID=UPI002008C7DC|nr:DUF788-domain-containing protein [Epithele typhae]KAH9943119.1 DUF788-domain-containing protein [Epithele typhae]
MANASAKKTAQQNAEAIKNMQYGQVASLALALLLRLLFQRHALRPTTAAFWVYALSLWAFDVVYITWACQVFSGAFGAWVWWAYLIIPLYAVYKLWSSVISPMFFGGSAASAEPEPEAKEAPTSKRQEKLRKRSERGDPRVRMQQQS